MSNKAELIEGDVARVAKVCAGLMDEVYTVAEGRGEADVRVEQFMVVGILMYHDEDGEEREAPVMGSESKRRYVQEGILHQALREYGEARQVDFPD